MTQPFFVTEHFTGKEGKLVSIEETLDGCEAILGGEFDDVAESALYMIGSIDEARAAAAPANPTITLSLYIKRTFLALRFIMVSPRLT